MFLSFTNVFAQDIIVRTDGELIRSKVVKVSSENIEYNKYDNLNGPIYVLPITEVEKIDFENGTVETFNVASKGEAVSLEDLKEPIIENLNKYAYSKGGKYKYQAEFRGDTLNLKLFDIDTEKLREDNSYEFSGECTFHDISVRKQGISYINVVVNKFFDKKLMGDPTKRFVKHLDKEGTKLVIRVKGHDKAEIIFDALKKYNDFFKEY